MGCRQAEESVSVERGSATDSCGDPETTEVSEPVPVSAPTPAPVSVPLRPGPMLSLGTGPGTRPQIPLLNLTPDSVCNV